MESPVALKLAHKSLPVVVAPVAISGSNSGDHVQVYDAQRSRETADSRSPPRGTIKRSHQVNCSVTCRTTCLLH